VGVVNGVGGHGDDGAGREVVVLDCGAGTWRDLTRQAEGGGAVDAEGFFDDLIEAAWR
jgi:hypothetical protein